MIALVLCSVNELFELRIFWMIGIKTAAVLPDPVLAESFSLF